MIRRETKHTERTWLGVRGVEWTFHANSNPIGRRVTALRWLEDNPDTGHRAGDLLLRDITGDFWRAPDRAVEHDHVVIPGGTDDDARAYAEKRLA